MACIFFAHLEWTVPSPKEYLRKIVTPLYPMKPAITAWG